MARPILPLMLLAMLALAFTACDRSIKDSRGVPLARVHGEYLYQEDLEGIVPPNTAYRDSIVMVRNYINNWIKTTLMVEKARYNLTSEQLDFDKRLEEYENSLIIFEYESKLIEQKLDTTVSEEELRTFYNGHLNDFELKENIVKVYYAVLDKELPENTLVENIFNTADSLVLDSLAAMSEVYGFTVMLDTSKWISFDELKAMIPIETYNQELFLRNKRFVGLTDDKRSYMLRFVDFKITDDISPFELVSGDIRDIILSKRKIQLIKNAREEIFQQAAKDNDFQIYYHE